MDELTFDLSFAFTQGIYSAKVRLWPKASLSNFYGPGARSTSNYHLVKKSSEWFVCRIMRFSLSLYRSLLFKSLIQSWHGNNHPVLLRWLDFYKHVTFGVFNLVFFEFLEMVNQIFAYFLKPKFCEKSKTPNMNHFQYINFL